MHPIGWVPRRRDGVGAATGRADCLAPSTSFAAWGRSCMLTTALTYNSTDLCWLCEAISLWRCRARPASRRAYASFYRSLAARQR
jgi:hypothetical protein